MTDPQPIVPEEAPQPPTPEELLPLLLTDILPAAKRNLDATSARHLAEIAKIANDMGLREMCSTCMQQAAIILAKMVTP